MANFAKKPADIIVSFGATKEQLQVFSVEDLSTQFKANQIPKAEISCSASGDGPKVDEDLKRCQPGEDVFIHVKKEGKPDRLIFAGIVMQQGFTKTLNRDVLTLSLRHSLTRLAGTQQSQVFTDKKDEQIINTLLSASKITNKVSLQDKTQHEQMVQCNSSEWIFLMSRIHANGAWLLASAEDVIVTHPALSKVEAQMHRLSGDRDESGEQVGIQEASWNFSHVRLGLTESFSSWDITQQSQIGKIGAKPDIWKGKGYDLARVEPLSQLHRKGATPASLSGAECKVLANAQLLEQYAAGLQARFILTGNEQTAKYQLGDTLVLSGFNNQCDGSAVISEIKQHFYQGRWDTTVGIGLPRAINPHAATAAYGTYIGVVEKLPAKKDPLFRLRVKVPALNNISVWARFSTPYASDNVGMCFYPEVNDEVVLDFLGQNPNYPIIQGSMHNPKHKPPIEPSTDNEVKVLVVASDKKSQKLVFDTKNDSALLANSNGYLVCAANEIEVATTEKLSISATKAIDITTEADMTLKGKKVDLTS
ncbi:MAG: hypothetical protein JKY31_04005 [Rhodobacteraceae bacterium]|nr:hypothetical protein [Paracoccaceae bacterium]